MFVPRGFGFSEAGDIEVVPHGDELHLFHLTLPNHDVVQHAVSRDGLAWRELPAALRTSDPGACDDDQIWTMSVTERDGDFVMLYTALSKAEQGQVQRTAVAHSADLLTWRKSERNPVAEADPRWYEAGLADAGRVSWRDPKPVLIDGAYYAVICAREKDGPLMRRGCAGLMTSTDLESWDVEPPLLAPRRYWDLECPQLFVIDGVFYLTAAIMEDRTQRYWMASSFAGPYEVPPDGGLLAPAGHYAGRVCTWQGRHLYFCWHRPGSWDRPLEVDWTSIENQAGKFVVAPLILTQRPDGSLARAHFPGWDGYRETLLTTPAPSPRTGLQGVPTADTADWGLVAEPGRMDLLLTENAFGDLHARGSLRVEAITGGLAFRCDAETSGGYFVELQAGSPEVLLKKWLPHRAPRTDRPWFRMEVLQRGTLPHPLTAGEPVPFKLTLSGPYIELELAGQVVLATLSAERQTGRLGIWAESGRISAEAFQVASLRLLTHS